MVYNHVMHLDAEKEMMSQCVALLGKFIAVREPNIRYLGLENMTRMLMVTDAQEIIKRHQAQIITSLKDPDISIRRRALDLLYGMCDVTNAKDIVEELLQYLSSADFTMREELSLKAAILAEKFAPDLSWYVDVILQLIDKAGDFISDDIWFRVVQFVTNNDDLQDHTSTDPASSQQNGSLTKVDPQHPSADLLGDLLGPLAIEGPPGATVQSEHNAVSRLEGGPDAVDGSAIVPVEEQRNTVQPIGNIAERFHALCLKDSGVLYEDPYIQIGIKAEWRAHHGRLVLFLGNKNTAPLVSVQALMLPPAHLKMELSLVPDTIPPRAQVQCPLEVVNLRPSRDVAVLDFSYKFGTNMVNVKLRLPAVLNKFLQPIPVPAEEFFPQWRSLSGPPLKLQEVVRGVRPMPLPEMANLLNSFRLMICPGLDPNPNNLVASTTFYSESTHAMLCLIRIETDPADRTQLRMTLASGDPTLTFELKEFIKEQLMSIPTAPPQSPAPAPPPAAQATPQIPPNDPAALLAGLLS
ncbi:hypothetical protein GOBAR_DD11137 [Gossypium barbadense]|nr:hypothetical protein GOBAR_DD11137 [Gossypium barbadense]